MRRSQPRSIQQWHACPAGGGSTGSRWTSIARLALVVLAAALAVLLAGPEPTAAQTPQQPPAGGRIALVIGNGVYAGVPPLANAVTDAKTIADTLRSLGFRTVRLEVDLGFEATRLALRKFAAEAASADWALIYYAGHGIELSGTNYIIPVDAGLKSDRDVQYETVALEQVMAAVEPAKRLRVVILDACRQNPFANQMTRTVATRAVGRGLARVEPEGGTLVVYAAKAGQVAYDGGQVGNSPFAVSLAKHMVQPGLEINMLFRSVRDDVLLRTDRQQEPFVYGSLPAESFYFQDPVAGAPTPPGLAALPAPPAVAAPTVPAAPPRSAPPGTPRPTVTPTRPTRARAAVAAERPAPAARRRDPATASAKGGGGRCFSFQGKSFCE